MAAYGLYTHIQSNKRRSIALLIGLLLLVYILVYAGALAAEALSYQASLDYLLRRAWLDFLAAAPWATVGTAVWIVIAYYFHQSMIDAITGGEEVTRQEQPRLYNLLENLCISRGITIAIVIAVALIVLAWILSVMIRFALSRSRELLADAGSVELTKNPDAMISALRKIEGRGEIERATSAIMEMCVDNPREGFAD